MLGFVLVALARRLEASEATSGPEFRAIFDEHAPYAFRCLRRLGVAPGDVDDVLQEVFLVVLRRHEEVAAESLRAWIHGVCVRKASDHRRGLRRRREQLEGEPIEAERAAAPNPTTRNPEQVAERNEGLARLDQVLAGLPEPERAAFVLYEIEQLSLKEIAAALECPISTAHSRLERARERVARAFSSADRPAASRRSE